MTDAARAPGITTPPFEALRARLPQATIPTNLPGVLALPPLPHGFDPDTASAAELLAHGLFWRRPEPGDESVAARAWRRAFAEPWLPEKHVVPVLVPSPGTRHHRRPMDLANSIFNDAHWGGCALDGAWTTVSAFWTIPKVTKPKQKAGSDGQWHSSSWVGLDGARMRFGDSTSNDLLQVGVSQVVDGDGHASYAAWLEWYCAYSKVTLSDSTPSCFALASSGASNLFLAFRGENNHLDILFSSDHGETFGDKLTSNEMTSQGPALALHQGVVFVAWAAAGNGHINVAEVTLTGTKVGLADKVTLASTTAKGPALASLDGVLYLAWNDADVLHVASSTDDGQTFVHELASRETSSDAPSLAVQGDQLFIAWKGSGNDLLNVATVAVQGGAPVAITDKLILRTETSPLGPAIASRDGVLYLSWRGDGNEFLTVMQSTDGGKSFFDKYISPEKSPSQPVLAVHEDQLFIGWRGGDDHLNVSVVGVRGGEIMGFSSYPYLDQVIISNLAVKAGDMVVCSALYLPQASGGYVAFGNLTTGAFCSMAIAPPPAASMNGATIEWIMEAPLVRGENAVLPAFTPVAFTDAFGCGANQAVGNPEDGDIFYVVDAAGIPRTATVLGSDTVTITYQP